MIGDGLAGVRPVVAGATGGHLAAEGREPWLGSRSTVRAPGGRASNSAGSMRRAPSAYTLAGPPERIDCRRLTCDDLLDRSVTRDDLGVDLRLADTAGDELGVLGAIVDDEDGWRMHLLRLEASERAGAVATTTS